MLKFIIDTQLPPKLARFLADKGFDAIHTFDTAGNCTDMDFNRMMKIVKKGLNKNFEGYIGVEYEGGFRKMMGVPGEYLDEDAGIRATKKLLERAMG